MNDEPVKYATCKWCKQEMNTDTCTGNTVVEYPDKVELPAIAYTPGYGGHDQKCHDCGISKGGFHHPGCDMERCPRCAGQLISCGCLDPETTDRPKPGRVDPEELRVEDIVSGYVLERYKSSYDDPRGFTMSLCSLCGNRGIIDTTASAKAADGRVVGKIQPCLCPNGMAISRNNKVWGGK